MDDLKAKSEDALQKLKLKKIEWAMDCDTVFSMRFTLSDGSVSPHIGKTVDVNESFDFPEDKSIRSVKVRHSDGFIVSLQFLDQDKKVLVEMIGDEDLGDWATFELAEREEIIGYKILEGWEHLQALGFITITK